MKTTTLPPLRVTPKFRKTIESVLDEGETLSEFMLNAVERVAAVRQEQRDFVATALARSQKAKRTGRYVEAQVVFGRLEALLAKAVKTTKR